ncbi:MAG: hypothetical protein VR65_01075 [Desulfobulbaceae bacterium BRH_c16a]|nr:MAG: hypothetical protein VR65_01075 [Desulfobulbaceae bacterium BRH_c16a]
MKIQILCKQCEKCEIFARNVMAAADEIGFEYELLRIFDRHRISLFGAMGGPVLVVNDEVRSVGRVLSPDQLQKLFKFILRAAQ